MGGISSSRRRRARRGGVLVFAGVTLLTLQLAPQVASAASVDASPTLVQRRVAQDGVVKQGALSLRKRDTVKVAGRGDVKVEALADEVLANHHQLNTQLAALPKGALLGAPSMDEQVIQTPQATVLVSSTTFTVTDADALRGGLSRVAPLPRSVRPGARMLVKQLTKTQRAALNAYKAELAGKPSSHPLVAAMNQGGDQALLDAIGEGLGDVTITTRVSVPTSTLARASATSLRVPTVVDGVLNYSKLATAVLNPALPPTISRFLPAVQGTGAASYVAKFLTGFTIDNSFEWEEEWDFGIGEFEIGAHAWYGFGLRVPVEFKVDTSPTTLKTKGRTYGATEYSTVVDPHVLNADASYYSSVGLKQSEVFDGKELVLTAGAYVRVKLWVLGGKLLDEKIPNNLQFDHGKQFTPPFESCGSNCGIDWWIPASVTRTQLSLLGLVSGSAQIGFKLGGTGKPKIDYRSVLDGEPIKSTKGKTTQVKHELSWSKDTTREFTTTIPYEADKGTYPYGWRLNNPRFDWEVTVTPGVKGTIDISAWPLNERITIGPYWLNAFAVNLGTLHLPTHDGTTDEIQMQPGQRIVE
ncbi:MAG: hypothetical protein H6713_05615 [Myxococcales bacterium]|nr:hypothetical protein [Myxococcales bacterium]